MNRQGQPPTRQTAIAPNPAMGGQFRPTYAYGPPRNVSVLPGAGGFLPGLPTPNHRAQVPQSQGQSLLTQAGPAFLQQRTQSNFAFGGALGQHQQSTALQQLPPQQTNGTAPSASSASEVALDPNDFPALGSTSSNNNGQSNSNGNGGNASTSYASQAGTALTGAGNTVGSGSLGGAAGAQARDFTPDDFPALGGQAQGQAQNAHPQSNQTQENQSHPPALNGFSHTDQTQQHRQNLIGALNAGQQTTPGMLNLGPGRSVHPGFQSHTETEKQQQQRNNYAMKLNQASNAAWNSPNATSASGAGPFANNAPAQNGVGNSSTSHLSGPPGVPPLPFTSNGMSLGEPANPNSTQNPSLPNSTTQVQQHPQTPAQQILMSAADRWGLLGLLAMIKNAGADVDHGLSSVGTDLGTMGLDMGYPGNLYSTFITPWADQSAAHTVEPDWHLPACYNVHPPAPGPSKVSAFSDETLFFMFYSSPRDALQEVAAQELFNRNWRYHKELRLWLTKESGTPASTKVGGGESGLYTYWDPESWLKERKDMTVLYADLEDKSTPAFVGPTLTANAVAAQQTQQPRGSF